MCTTDIASAAAFRHSLKVENLHCRQREREGEEGEGEEEKAERKEEDREKEGRRV